MKRVWVVAAALTGVLAIFMVGCAEPKANSVSTPSTHPAGGVKITFLHVNDVHGQLQPRTQDGQSVGGYARLASVVQQVRSSGQADRVFLIHCGDEVSRGDELTERTHGGANVAIMNRLEFDLWTPGNGEFYDVDGLRQMMDQARFPMLTSNLQDAAGGKTFARPYVIERAGDVRIAFFGLCFLHKESLGVWPVKLREPVETAKTLVPQLRQQADLVVAVDHIGKGQDVRLAQIVDGIDLILGGHTHTVLENGVRVKNPSGRETLVCQAGEQLDYVGQVDLTLVPNKEGRYELTSSSAKLIRLDQKIPLDPGITALIAKLSEKATQPATAPALK